MPASLVGDLSQSFTFRRQNAALKTETDRHLKELSSGRTSDLAGTVRGDFTSISGIERTLTLHVSWRQSAQEATLLADGQQASLETVRDMLSGRGAELAAVAGAPSDSSIRAVLAEAGQDFDTLISRLNTRAGGRTAFAGAATQGAAVADPEVFLTELATATAGALTAADAITAIDDWFDTPGGGFDTLGYLGSDTDLSPFAIGDGSSATVETTAADLRETIKVFATVALMDEGLFAGDQGQQAVILGEIGGRMLDETTHVIDLQERLGVTQAHIETVMTRNSAEEVALQMARDAIVGIDPYDTASRLEEVSVQLELLYAVTARLSRMSMANAL